jgi:galactokinase
MAIDQDILIAVKPREDQQLELSNLIPNTYEDYSCGLDNIE